MPVLAFISPHPPPHSLALDATTDIGLHYAVTLRHWRALWEERKDEVLALGYSDRFWRKYQFYFAYCEAGFDYRYIHNFHVVWSKHEPQAVVARAAGPSEHRAISAGTEAIRSVMQSEMPDDPVTQVLLAAYFFLSGLLVHSHPLMWLLPTVTLACAAAHHATHQASRALLPFYRQLSPEKQAWWCADVAHLVFSCSASLASLLYIVSSPASMLPWRQESVGAPCSTNAMPCAIACASAGFFAFNLWLSVRYHLYTQTLRPVMHFTLLLALFVVAAYKGVSVPLLSASLLGELSNVPYIIGKLSTLAGVTSQSLTTNAELLMLAVTMSVHGAITVLVLAYPAAFGNVAYYCVALLGMTYCNGTHWFRARQLLQAQAHAHATAKQHTPAKQHAE
ncbi:hypothetical protein FOA52_014558 [Chlamydomonas sp. UWO 241]|nr:hypothetical protein FOA52_014558 [Chlamydomonas sp. UWO 241]